MKDIKITTIEHPGEISSFKAQQFSMLLQEKLSDPEFFARADKYAEERNNSRSMTAVVTEVTRP